MRVIFVALMCLSFAVNAETLFVDKINAKGVSDSDAETLQGLFRTALEDAGADLTLNYDKADFRASLRVYKLGKSYVIQAKKNKGSELIHSAKQKVNKIDEADVAVARVAEAIVKEKKPTAKVGKVTESEEKTLTRRRKSKQSNYFFLGKTNLNKLQDNDGSSINLTFGSAWDVRDQVTIGVNFDMNYTSDSDNDARLNVLGLVGNYYFLADDISPYVGGNFGYAWSKYNSSLSDSGFAVGVQAGATFFRTSDVHLGAEVKYRMLIDKDDQNSPEGTPSALSFGVGLYW